MMLVYRTDIQGLRAIAVLSVVFFHLNIGCLHGGFIGVDVFFVISGYLISRSIYKDLSNHSFSIVNFYARRAKRILPAFFSILFLCTALAFTFFFPTELVDYAKSAIASAFFSANIYFYSTLNYFSQQATEIPLLHLWSLGIEEQFYIFFPLIIMAFHKYLPNKISTIILGILLSSLCGSIWMVAYHPSAAFYLLPFRAFELLMGSALALPIFNRKLTNSFSMPFHLLGFILLIFPIIFFNNKLPFPGINAFIPCLGTALIIFSGQNAHNIFMKLLCGRALVFIGRISYSLYLVHWPIIVFGKCLFPNAATGKFAFLSFVISIILAYVSYEFVEQYFLKPKEKTKNNKPLVPAFFSLATIILTCGFIINTQGFRANLDTKIASILSFLTYDIEEPYRRHVCFLEPEDRPEKIDFTSCLPNLKDGKKVMLWGDSHAIHLFSGLKKTLKAEGYSLGVLSASACPPIIGIEVAARPLCKAFNEKSLPIILKEKPQILIMSADWSPDEHTMKLLEKTIKKLSTTNIKVIILGHTPTYKQSVPTIVANRLKASNSNKFSNDELSDGFLSNSEIMKKRFSNRDDVTYVSVIDTVCKNNKCPLLTPNNIPTHFDTAHLTEEGSNLFAKYLTPYILFKNSTSSLS